MQQLSGDIPFVHSSLAVEMLFFTFADWTENTFLQPETVSFEVCGNYVV